MEDYRYSLYLQRCNGYWIKEPYQTLDEVQEAIDILDEEEYWWYLVIDNEKAKSIGDGVIGGGRVHTKQEHKIRTKK